MQIAKLAASRSTCLATPVGAAIVKDRQVIATGYNGVPAGWQHCTDLGHCYQDVAICSESERPSRAIHAEINAIAQCARRGMACDGATIYVTKMPCINCSKAILAAGIDNVCIEGFGCRGSQKLLEKYFL